LRSLHGSSDAETTQQQIILTSELPINGSGLSKVEHCPLSFIDIDTHPNTCGKSPA